MIDQKKTNRILWYETLGFALLIALSWLNELVNLSALIFGSGNGQPNIHEAILETVALVLVWIGVMLFTRRLLRRLFYLDGFLRVCAWCRKIGQDDDWVTLEEFFAKGFNMETSHGMCPECQAQWVEKSRKRTAAV